MKENKEKVGFREKDLKISSLTHKRTMKQGGLMF